MAANGATTDVIIIGAGPVGLFAVFQLGLAKLKAHVVDILDRPGGQCAELYPEKPIYDIPGLPVCTGQELTDRLLEQIRPFEPVFHFGEMAAALDKTAEGHWQLTTDAGLVITAPVLVIAAGGGSFVPKRPPIPGIEAYEGSERVLRRAPHRGVSRPPYRHRRRRRFRARLDGQSRADRRLAHPAASPPRIPRRSRYGRARCGSWKRKAWCASSSVSRQRLKGSDGKLEAVAVKRMDGSTGEIAADTLLPFFGLTMKLGPIANFGLNLNENLIPVDTEKFETGTNVIFAIGDINTYPGKLKLILSGFHEAALMAQAAHRYVHPDKKLRFQYTTSSSELQRLLKVA